ncbi:phosphate-selective porin OprO and OprP [Tenacibaculum insulae]
MKKLTIVLVLFLVSFQSNAQEMRTQNQSGFDFGKGLNFSFNDGAYRFKLSGMIQPRYQYVKEKGAESDNIFSAKRAFLSISGKAVNEKIGFFVQTDYSQTDPLLDAWISYDLFKNTTIFVGQKLSFVNNRSMNNYETHMQFTERGYLSSSFSNTGREFGLFVESKFGSKIGIVPQLAVTSGDGKNSFGSDSRDTDLGGLKFGGRLDVYPLGYFKEGNQNATADLMYEDDLKVVLGGALSKNVGVSNSVGEGHGNFELFDVNGESNLPDYTQMYIDILAKYKGISFLAEYVNASAENLKGIYTDATGSTILAPTQISEYLALGDGYNLQLGYLTRSGFSFDVRYENITSEFDTNTNAVLQDSNATTFGVSKYIKGNSIKIQAAYSSVDFDVAPTQNSFELMLQIVF